MSLCCLIFLSSLSHFGEGIYTAKRWNKADEGSGMQPSPRWRCHAGWWYQGPPSRHHSQRRRTFRPFSLELVKSQFGLMLSVKSSYLYIALLLQQKGAFPHQIWRSLRSELMGVIRFWIST